MTLDEVKSLYGEPNADESDEVDKEIADAGFVAYSYGKKEDLNRFGCLFKDNKVEGIVASYRGSLQREIGTKIGFPDDFNTVSGMDGGWMGNSPVVKTIAYHQLEMNGHVIVSESGGETFFMVFGENLYNSSIFPYKQLFDSMNVGK